MKVEELLSLQLNDVITNGKETFRVLSVGEDHVCVDVSWQEVVVRDHVYDISADMWEIAQNPPIKKGQPKLKLNPTIAERRARWQNQLRRKKLW
jgi:hypothetical protein